jgi:hypothetical protein
VKIRKKLLTGATTAATSLGVAVAGLAVVPAPAAHGAVLSETDYGFQGTAYGTRVLSDVVGLESGRSAFSYLGCTRKAGLKDRETLAQVSVPAVDPVVEVSGVDSNTRTVKRPKRNIAGAMISSNRIGKVVLGNSSSPKLTIQGLRTQSKAWATNSGALRTSNKVSSVDISLVDLPANIPPELQGPLQDLLDALEGGIAEVIGAIQDNAGTIVIPNLGEVSLGFDRQVKRKSFAAASSFVLQVLLYGENLEKGGGDDSMVGIGRSWARINRNLPAGVMGGVGYGANARVLDGVVSVGRLGEQALPCPGTNGKVLSGPTAGLDFLSAGQLKLAGLRGRSFGVQRQNGVARAWTEGAVANLTMGPLEIKGITGRVNLRQNKAGRIVKNNIRGSSVGEVIVDGESLGSFGPGEAKQIPADGIPGVVKIELFKRDRAARRGEVSAVVITFAEGTPGVSELRLGNARAIIKRY